FQRLELSVFNCFPLRRSWSPCYMLPTAKKKKNCQNILQRSWNNDGKLVNSDYWYEVIDLNSRTFSPQK
ncbi:hypothetical protein BX666DRAFT_1816126, partial [Dichotomocladium elegans]